MTAKSRYFYYYPQDAQLQQYLSSISNRLDKLEGLRGSSGFEGILERGVVPLARMQRTEVSSENASQITATSGEVTVTTVDLGTVNAGDRILLNGFSLVLKGATAGTTGSTIQKSSGTATIEAYNDFSQLVGAYFHQINATSNYAPVSGIMKVTASGTLVLKLVTQSFGSDGTILVGRGQLHAVVLNNG